MSDTIQEKCEQAVAKKHSGYNCAQAVACTFCEEAGLDDETMRNLMQGFGAGLAFSGCAFDHAAVYGAEWNGYLQRTERNRNRTCGPRL